MFKKYIFTFIWILLSVKIVFADLAQDMLPEWDAIISSDNSDWFNLLDNIFKYIKDSIFWFLAVIAIWAFLYVWAKLVVARWNPEEFKKAILSFVYIVVWLFIISVAWAVVKLVSWLNF